MHLTRYGDNIQSKLSFPIAKHETYQDLILNTGFRFEFEIELYVLAHISFPVGKSYHNVTKNNTRSSIPIVATTILTRRLPP